jgi:hypothetical protein
MPYDFLATQPAMAAAQIQAFLPGLQSAMPPAAEQRRAANWALLLTLAIVATNRPLHPGAPAPSSITSREIASGHWLRP